jgi:hypothetical protein
MAEQYSQPRAYLGGNDAQPSNVTNTGNKAYLDDSLYAPLSSSGGSSVQQFTGDEEVDKWLNTLPAEQRQIELDAINAPLTGEEVAQKRAKNPLYVPTLEEFKALRDYKKTQDTEFLSGLGEAAMHIAGQFGSAAEFIAKHPLESTYKAPANLVEATFQGFRNFYGMLGESENPDSVMFKFKDLITGDGTDESQYDQYLKALQFNNDTNDLMSGKQTIVMNKDYINNEIVQVTSNFTDPTLLVGLMTGGVGLTGKIAQAIGQAERLAAFGAKASAIKNGLYAGTLRWGAGVPLEMIGGATRNTIDYAVQKGANAFEFASGISAAEGQNYVRRFGFGTAVTDLGGYGVPIASELSQAYVGAGIAKGFGEALNATIATAEKQGFKRGGISFARQALEESNAMLAKGGQGLSKHASNLLKVLDKADPFLIYARTGLEGATAGMVVGGGLGYLNDKEQGMYSGMGAGMALGAIGALGGRGLSDISGATRSMRYGVQAKMALEIMKDRSPVSNQTWSLLQNVFSKNVDDINKLIVAVDTALPNTEWATMSPDELKQTLKARGLDPDKFDGFEHETVPAFEPKAKQTDFSQVSPEKYANFLAIDFGYLPETMKNAISGGDLSSFRDLLVKKGLTKFKDVPDNIVKLVADEYIKRENTHRAEVQGRKFEFTEQQKARYDRLAAEESGGKQPKGTAEAYKKQMQDYFEKNKKDYYHGSQEFTKNERFKRQVETALDVQRSLDPSERAKDLQQLKDSLDPKNIKIYEETLRRAKEEGLVNSKGVGEAEASVVRYKKDANGNKIRAIDEMGYELPTVAELSGASGWHESKGVGGKSRVVINTDWLSKNTAPHEFGHGIFSELVFQPVFKERIRGYVLGNVDKDGKMITPPLIDLETAKKFFTRYIDIENTAEISVERKQLLDKALKEYFIDGKMNVIDPVSKTPFLEKLVEEFGTYYWTQFIKGKPVDFLFRGGEMSMMDNVLEMVKNGYIDMMKTEIERANPNFRFNEDATSLNDAFTDRKGNRVRVPELDALMTDMVKAVMQTNRKGSFDFSSLSVAGQEAYIKANGLERIVKKQPTGKYKVMSDKELDVANKARGVEIFKALDALDPKLKVVKDDKGNVIGGLTKVNNEYVGLLSNEVLDHLVATGHMSQGESSKIKLFQDISLGKTKANVVEMTYFGLSAQTTTGAVDIRVYGNKVPVKNRKVLVLGVDNTFRQNGVFSSKLSTMDWQVIETRGKNLWEDPVVRQLWGDDRGAFEGDFFRYLENASKPKTDPTRINDFAELWQESGAMKRNIMQQFAGLGKQADVAYANTPLTEIHWDINQSFMYLRADRASNIRLSNERITYDHRNAGHDISRNMMPAEMMSEDTPNGKIHKHPSGYRFIENDKGVRVFDANGDDIGSFKNLDDALVKAKQDYTEKFPNEKPIDSLDNVKADVVKPQFESRAEYINKRVIKQLKSMGGNFHGKAIKRLKEKIEQSKFDLKLSENKQSTGLVNMRDLIEGYTKDVELFQKLLDGFESGDLSKLTQTEILAGLDRLDPYVYPKVNKTILDMFMEAGIVFAKEWDAKYPMTFRSPLDDAIKSFFAGDKEVTAQQLLKKLLRVGSSKGIQIYSEADAIGLVKLLKSKIEKTKSIHRTINPETGNYYPRGTPDAPVIEKVAGEKPAILDKDEILKYLDENKIILTIEENAKEVRGLNTEDYTADGTRSGYRETALRINPMYMHDVIGHYNKAVAHLRTTDRVDSEGNRVNFGDEYQANNTDRANEKNLIYLKRRAERAKKFLGILDLNTLKNVALTDDAVNSSLEKLADSTITSFDIEAVVGQLINSQSTSKERAFNFAIQNAALNAAPDGGTLTNFSEKKLKNYALTINNLIDAWASSSLQLLGKVSEGEYKSYLHTGRDDSINARNIIDRGVLSKENMTKFIKFVQNNYKLNLNKPAYDLFLELASHNTMFVQGFGEPLFMPENNQKVGLKVHRELLSLAADRVTKTKEFTKENGFDDLQKIIQEGYFGGRYKLDYIMPEKIMTGITEFANLGEMKRGRKSNVLDRLGNGTNLEYLEDVHSYLSFGNIRFTENGDVFFRPIGDDYGRPLRATSVGHGAREIFVNSFKHFDSKEIVDSLVKRAMVQDSLKERLQRADESSEAIDRESWKFEDLSKDKIMEWSIDFQSQIDRYNAANLEGEAYPFMSVEEWGVHLIKMQIREAIQKGQRKITITHPDDSPTKSNAPESRYRMYGVILPNLARGIVKKYGIEVKQDLKLHTKNVSDALEAHGKHASVTHVLMQNALDIFQRNASGESADVINKITIELAMPVKNLIAREKDRLIKNAGKTDESTIESATRLSRDGGDDWNFTTTELIQNGVNNPELRIALQNVVGGKTNEWKSYSKYLIESERSIKGKQMPSNVNLWTIPDADKAKLQTELAIDRGYSFILNDEIIQAFIRNDEGTAMKQYMPRDKKEKVVPRIVNKEEYNRMMSIIKSPNMAHLKAAYDREDITFDNFDHSKYRNYHVVSHGLDNAPTFDWTDSDTGEVIHKGEGGGTYPAYKTPYAWATTKPDMADMINRVGELNKAEHGEWIAPVMFFKSPDTKTRGTPNGSNGYLNAMSLLNRKGAIDDVKFKNALVLAFNESKKPIGNIDTPISELLSNARSILSDKTYAMKSRAKLIERLNSKMHNVIDFNNPEVQKLIPTIGDYTGKKIIKPEFLDAVFGMMSDPLFSHAKSRQSYGGDVYGMLMFDGTVRAEKGDFHGSYAYSIIKTDGTPVKVDYLTTPINPTKLVKSAITKVKYEKGNKSMPVFDEEGNGIYKTTKLKPKSTSSFMVQTGQTQRPIVHNKLYMPRDVNDKTVGKIVYEPRDISWVDIGHYPNDGDHEHNVWENRNSGLWADFDGKITTKNPQEWDDPSFTHSEWFMGLRRKHRDDRRAYSPESSGRYENPKYDADGKLTEKGRISVTSLTDREYTMDGLDKDIAYYAKVKKDLADRLGFPAVDYDAYLFRPSKKIQKEMGVDLDAHESYGDGLYYNKAIKFMPNEFKDGLKRLIDAVDAQSNRDQVPANVKAGVSTLVQAIKRQGDEDVRAGIIRGVQQLADAIDRQSDEDKVPERVKAGIKNLIKASQEVGKPVKPKAQPRTTAKTTPKNVQVENEPAPETQPVFNNNFPQPQFTSKWRSFVQENTTDGNSIFKNAMNYVIIQAGKKYRVYNPYKTMIGIYDDLEQAKRRVQRDEPKQR